MVRACIAGASGYGGGELLRLLDGHPEVEVAELAAGASAGRSVDDVWPHLRSGGGRRMRAVEGDDLGTDADVAFLSLPAGPALELAPRLVARGVRVVDLGADFRLRDPALYRRWYGREHTAVELLEKAVYGLPELDREGVAGARLVANPGCYATAALLALAPLVHEGLAAGPVFVDGKSGISGAGRSPTPETGFAEANENVRAYSVANHRHTAEIEQALARVGDTSDTARVCFVPHVVPMTRGIMTTCFVSLRSGLDEEAALELYRNAYGGAPFVRVSEKAPQTKATAGSNHCDITVRVDAERETAVVLAALDNLGKGAAGQAVQNMNLMLGLDEREGLWKTPIYP